MLGYRTTLVSLSLLTLVCPPYKLSAAERIRASYAALNASQSPLWIAQERRIYAKHGLEVDLVYISSGSMNVQALVGGSVQFAAGGPAAVVARLQGVKLLVIANPLPVLASDLLSHPSLKAISDLKGKIGGISRFGSSTDQGIRYLFRKNGLNIDTDLKLLQLGDDVNRLAALSAGKVQYTFLGGAATEQAKAQGFRVLATAQQMAIPFPWTSAVVNESWLGANREIAYRYVKALTEAIRFMKRNRADSERVIAKYMKVNDPHLITVEYDFNVALLPDLPYPTLDGMRLILENLARQNPDAARRDPREFVDSSIVDRLKREQFLESLNR
jgi:NitT/TauT family transport system substrate-binding protein